MVEFQIIDVDYVIVDNKPVIRVFGKTEAGESVCGFYEGYEPYFYADGKEVPELLENEQQVVRIEKVKKNMVMGFDRSKEIHKITLQNPSRTPDIREMLKEKGAVPYEADILFSYRFMIDHGLGGFAWIRTEESNGASTQTVQTDKKIKLSKIEPIKKDVDAPLKIMAFDIECIALERGTLPDARTDPVIMISAVFSEPHNGKESLVLGTRSDEGVVSFGSEKEMLEGFIDIVKDYDPDIITGYNVNNFDLPYIIDRMRQNKVRPTFGRCNEKQVMAKKIMNRYKISITGRVIVDSFELIKKDYSLQRYGLDFVSRALLNEEKVDVKHSDIEKLWKGTPEEFSKLVKYSRIDSVLAMNLVVKLKLIDKYVALSKISGTLFQDTLNSGETTRIENFLLTEFNRRNYVYPCKPDQKEISTREFDKKRELKGGAVLEPDKGAHSSVIVLDFKSMYPSIIRSYNMCPTTLVMDKNYTGKAVEVPGGAMFVPRETKVGIIPGILEQLMDERQSVKKRLNKETDPVKKNSLHAQQWAFKILANAFYGHMGYVRAKIYNLEIANAITSSGRNIIQRTKDEIEKTFGYRVVYGDTDSVMVKMNETDMKKIKEIGDSISEHITKMLPGCMELEFEKYFKRFLPLTKKRYVAWKFEPKGDDWEEGIEMKGIETVRRDWCGLVSETMKEVIEIILKKDDSKGALVYFRDVITKLLKGEIDMDKLVITKTITKAPERYAGIQPHIELAKKIQARSPTEAPGVGDRIGYVITKGTGLLSTRTEDPGYVAEKGLEIDSKYYIENQLLPPLERIFAVLNVSKSQLLGNGKQMGLLEAINNSNGNGGVAAGAGIDIKQGVKQLQTHKERDLSIEDTSGFICTKCNNFYTRVPLVGMCECGGELAFSSPKGIAQKVSVV
jgi:DNA polymerase I